MSEPTVVPLIAEVLKTHRLESCSEIAPGIHEYWGRCTGCEFIGPRRTRFGPEWELNVRDDETTHQAGVVASRLNLHEERRKRLKSGVILDADAPGWDGAALERRWVSDWTTEEQQ